MNIKDALDERIIDLEIEVNDKEAAITHLSKKLKAAGYIENIDEFIKDIYEREAQGITGIGNYIAIPHGKSDAVKQVGIAIGRLKKEIAWETLDDKGVSLIFLFAVSNDHDYARNHMKLLAEIAMKLGNDETVEKLQNVQNIEELKEIFKD